MHFRAYAGLSNGVELETRHGRTVRRHRGHFNSRHPVRLRNHRRAHRLRAGAVAGGRAFDGTRTRGGRMFRHCRRADRVRHVTAH